MIHGLELQGRSLAATQGDQDNIAFLVGQSRTAMPYHTKLAKPCHAMTVAHSPALPGHTMPYHAMLLLLSTTYCTADILNSFDKF